MRDKSEKGDVIRSISPSSSDSGSEGKEGALSIRHLSKTFTSRKGERVHAVRDLFLNVCQGELVTLLGPSGCGKTTVLRLIAGFETPDQGIVQLGGEVLNDISPHARKCGLVFQNYALFPHLTVRSNLAFSLRLKKRGKNETARRVQQSLEAIGLVEKADSYPFELSGGQQQRVALARTLLSEPRLLLFDEPLSNLDVKLRAEMREEIRRVQKKAGITSLYVTHDQEEAMIISDRIAVMRAGRIEQVGSGQQIYRDPVNLFVARFVGRLNQLNGEIVDTRAGRYSVRILGRIFHVNEKKEKLPRSVWAAVRPEAIDFIPVQEADIVGEIRDSIYSGSRTVMYITAEGTEITVERHSGSRGIVAGTGEVVGLDIREDSIRLFPREEMAFPED
jgi:iron(III) transport system ATP-binding protein